MKLWRIFQTVNHNYDSWDSAVVAADTETEARKTHPGGPSYAGRPFNADEWAKLEDVQCVCIGEAAEWVEPGVIVASFNAG